MGISLEKGAKISLAKDTGESLTKVKLAAGWDAAKSTGFLGFGGGSIDLDLSAVLFNEKKEKVDEVYFGNLRNRNNSIVHSGDNLTGAGEGDDEVITVDLTTVPSEVSAIVFTISSFRGQTFKNVSNAFCRVIDATNNKEMARYDLSAKGDYTALIIAKFYRHNGAWKMHAIGETTNGRTIREMQPALQSVI